MDTLKNILKKAIELAGSQNDLTGNLNPAGVGTSLRPNLPVDREDPNSVKSADIKIKPSHKGLLHQSMGVPEGEKIPASKLESLKAHGTPAERRRANFALNARKWHHKKGADAAHPGLWANIRAKRARGGKPAKPGDEGYPDRKNWKKLTHQKKANLNEAAPIVDSEAQRKKDAIWSAIGNGTGGAVGGAVLGGYISMLHPEVQKAYLNKLMGNVKDSFDGMRDEFGEGWKKLDTPVSFGSGSFGPEERAARAEAIQRALAKKRILKLVGRNAAIGAGALGAITGLAGYANARAGHGAHHEQLKEAGEGSIPDVGAPHTLPHPMDPDQAIMGLTSTFGNEPKATPAPTPIPTPTPLPHYPASQSAEGFGAPADTNFLNQMQQLQKEHDKTLPLAHPHTQQPAAVGQKLGMYLAALKKLAAANVVMHKEDKSPSGGLTQHGRDKYNRATGSHLKAPVTQKNPTGKAKARRASFCARMRGVKGPMKDEHGRPTRKALALRKWNCH